MKKLIIIFLLIMVCISFYEIIDTYALYKSQITADYEDDVGKWIIKINNYDIDSENVAYIYQNQSLHTSTGTIAPGNTATFEMEIDPTGTDVAIMYAVDLTIDSDTIQEEDYPFNDYVEIDRIVSTFEKDGETAIVDTTNNTVDDTGKKFKGIIPLDKINSGYKNKITVYLKWINNEANNEIDTDLGKKGNADFNVAVKLELKQYLGETWNTWEETTP